MIHITLIDFTRTINISRTPIPVTTTIARAIDTEMGFDKGEVVEVNIRVEIGVAPAPLVSAASGRTHWVAANRSGNPLQICARSRHSVAIHISKAPAPHFVRPHAR